MHAEQMVDCPFSLSVDVAHLIFPVLESPAGGVRVPYRLFFSPLHGAIARRVRIEFQRRPDATERGRAHDEIAFDWNARSRLLPNFHGVLRFRSESTQTRVTLDGSFVPPFGWLGAMFDRAVGKRLAGATARDILHRLARGLEARWTLEKQAAAPRVKFLALLLVATDGSDTGDRAVTYALALATRHGSDVVFCYAVDRAAAVAECSASNGGGELLMPLVQDLDDAAGAILADAARRATEAGIAASTALLDGRAAEAVVACARERRVDAIVMGTRGKGALERFFLGSTADGVLRHSDVPVFVIPPGTGDAAPAFDSILVAVDDSEPSAAAAAFALDLAAADEARLVFCAVAPANAAVLAVQTERARAKDLAFERFVAEGDATEQIVRAAQARRVGSIVLGTHGRRGLQRSMLGSVAEGVVIRSPAPVVVVRVSHVLPATEDVLTTPATSR